MSEAVEEEVDDLRAAVSAAFEKADAAAAEPAEPVAEAAEPAVAETPAEPEPAAGSERQRRPDGTFLPKADAPVAAKPVAPAASDAPKAPVVPAAPALRAPQSWKPEAREKWAALPPEAQAEIDRRERETSMALTRSAEQARALEPLQRVIAPFAQQLAARGQEPAQVVANFLRTEQALSHPDERQRASVLVQAMRTYGISVEALAGAIDSQPAQQASQAIDPQAIIAQAEQRVFARLNAQQAQGATSRAAQEIEAFRVSGEAEFLEDLKPGIVARLGAGLASNLKEAYEQERWADPRIRGILQQREASKQAATGAQATQRARAASTSVRSSPGSVPAANAAPDSWTEALEQQYAKAGQ